MSKQAKEPKVCAARTVYRKWWDGKGKEHRITAGCQLGEGHEPPHHHEIEWDGQVSEPTPTRGEQATTGLQSGPQPAPHPLIERLRKEADELDGFFYHDDVGGKRSVACMREAADALADSIPVAVLREHRLMQGDFMPYCDCGKEIESYHDWLVHLQEVRDRG